MEVLSSLTVPARSGRAFHVKAGEHVRLVTPKGAQAVDFFAFVRDDLREWLSPMHTWVSTRCLRPREGDTFLTRRRRPVVRFVEDGAGGVHDMLLAACDSARYEQVGAGQRAGCGDNMLTAMAELGYETDVVPQPVNFFTNTDVDEKLTLGAGPNPVPPGGYVLLEALMDLVSVACACPWDRAEPWPVNAPEGPTEIEAIVYGG